MLNKPLLMVALAACALAAVLALSGWFQPTIYPDSSGYIELARGPNPWGEARHPLYGFILIGLERLGLDQSAVPVIQFALHVVAALALTAAARAYGLSSEAALALGLAALCGQAVVLWGRAVLPEMLAISFMLMALSAILMLARGPAFWIPLLLATLTAGMSQTLRPIMLPGIVILPALYLILTGIKGLGWPWLRALGLALALVSPMLGQSTYRWATLGDFDFVSFGGFGSTGLAGQILSADLLPRLPEDQRATAAALLAARDKAIAEQRLMPLVRNSAGERSYATTALDAFDVLARNFDDVAWTHAMALRQPGESWVAFNRRMAKLSGSILRAAPERVVLWNAGAFSRLIGRLLTYNVAFLLALGAFAAVALWNIARKGSALGGASGADWTPMVLMVGAWVALSTVLTVLVAFPALRYVDTGGLMLTALPLYGLFVALRKTKPDAPR